MLSNSAEYALKAVLFIAGAEPARTVRAVEIAEGLGIPANYLSKILHELTRSGVLKSNRGRNGGFTLSRPASELSLAAVVGPFNRFRTIDRTCLLSDTECDGDHPCSAHARWMRVQDTVVDFFEGTMIEDLRGPEDLKTLHRIAG